MTTMHVFLHTLIPLVLMALAIGLTALHWRKVVKKNRMLANAQYEQLKSDSEVNLQNRLGQQMEAVHMDRMRDRVAMDRQAHVMNSKLDFYHKVLLEVQTLQECMACYTKLITSTDLQPDQGEWNMVCNELKKRTDQMTEMVNGTLELMDYEDMTEIERNDQIPVNSFCQDVFDSCLTYRDGNVDMRLETCLDDDETVTTNMKCLQKVLVNLLKCSMQFTHEGEIVLVVKRCHQQNELSFAVSDTGLGIPEEAKESAFERIRNTDVSIKIVVVRLRLCRALVRLLGGTIYQDPHRKKGTSIVFTIKA